MNISSLQSDVNYTVQHELNPSLRIHWMNMQSQVKPRSAFAKIIAQTYFIPGITGRARCLQDHNEPETANSCHDHNENSTVQSRTIDRLRPNTNPSAWEIERHHQTLVRDEPPIVMWLESPSFLRKKASSHSTSTARTTATYSLSNSERTVHTSQTRTSQNTRQRSKSRTMQFQDSSDDIYSSTRRGKHFPVANTNHVRPSIADQDKSPADQQRGTSRSRIKTKRHVEHESIQSLRVASTHDLLRGNGWAASIGSGSRPVGPVRASSTRSGCRYKERKSVSTASSSLIDGQISAHCHSTLRSIPEIPGRTTQRPTLPVRAMSTRSCQRPSSSSSLLRRVQDRNDVALLDSYHQAKQRHEHRTKRRGKTWDSHYLSDDRPPIMVVNIVHRCRTTK